MKNGLLCNLVCALCLIVVTSCASIPKEAPELSENLGERIEKIELANITLLHKFFEQKRRDVDYFIEREWLPVFSEQFFSRPEIARAWAIIVREDDNPQRMKFLLKVGTKIQEKLNSKRTELIRPLDELEKSIKTIIITEYDQAKAINNSITSFLHSAAKVAENRDRYLKKIGYDDEKFTSVIDKTDAIVSGLLSKAEGANEKLVKAEGYIKKLRELKDSL